MTGRSLMIDLLSCEYENKPITLNVAGTDVEYKLCVIVNHHDRIVLRGYEVRPWRQ